MVEMAFVIFILVLLIFGMTEFGRAMYYKNTLNNAARGLARVLVVTPSLSMSSASVPSSVFDCRCTSPSCPTLTIPTTPVTTIDGICERFLPIVKDRAYVKVEAFDGTTTNPRIGTIQTGDTIKVTVVANFHSFLPRLHPIGTTDAAFGANETSLSGQASMRYER